MKPRKEYVYNCHWPALTEVHCMHTGVQPPEAVVSNTWVFCAFVERIREILFFLTWIVETMFSWLKQSEATSHAIASRPSTHTHPRIFPWFSVYIGVLTVCSNRELFLPSSSKDLDLLLLCIFPGKLYHITLHMYTRAFHIHVLFYQYWPYMFTLVKDTKTWHDTKTCPC